MSATHSVSPWIAIPLGASRVTPFFPLSMKRVGGPSGPAGMRMMYPAPSLAEP